MARLCGGLALALALGGCGGGAGLFQAEEAPNAGMAGRWMLEAPRAPSCGLNFSDGADGRSGRVVPEGGCPGGFYKGRRWALESGTLTIRDDNGDAVGQFSQAGEKFDGKSATGLTLTLTRPVAPPSE